MVWVWEAGAYHETPYLHRIVQTTVYGYFLGLFAGAVFVFLSEVFNGSSLDEASKTVLRWAPLSAFVIGYTMAIYSIFLCTVEWARSREGPINFFVAGSLTGAFVADQESTKSILTNAVVFGFVLGALMGAF